MRKPNPGIIVALDVPRLEDATKLVEELAPHVRAFKVGHEICTAIGVPAAIRFIHERGGRVFLDLKFGDIPNTVGKAVLEAAKQGVWMTNVHANCGAKSMATAVANRGETLVIAVTALTSLGDEECQRLYGRDARSSVRDFAHDAALAGTQGIVCSAADIVHLYEPAPGFLKVTPGIRPLWAAAGDQKRVFTPAEARSVGSDYIVIGRPIISPPPEIGSPLQAVKHILAEFAVFGEDSGE
jgi:orotidine-5'-phosphate decarboxylase